MSPPPEIQTRSCPAAPIDVEDRRDVALDSRDRGAVGVGPGRPRGELLVVGDEPDREAAVRQVVTLRVQPAQRPAPDDERVHARDEVGEVAVLAVAWTTVEERHVVSGAGDPAVDRHRGVPDDVHAYVLRACSIA